MRFGTHMQGQTNIQEIKYRGGGSFLFFNRL